MKTLKISTLRETCTLRSGFQGKTKEEAVYVGDSDVDIMTAKNVGIPCISVEWGFRDRKFLQEHGAEHLIKKPEEIWKYL